MAHHGSEDTAVGKEVMVAGANCLHCTRTQQAEHKQEVQLHYMDPGPAP